MIQSPETKKKLRIFVKSLSGKMISAVFSKSQRNSNSAHYYRSNEGFDKSVSHVKLSQIEFEFLTVCHWSRIANSRYDATNLDDDLKVIFYFILALGFHLWRLQSSFWRFYLSWNISIPESHLLFSMIVTCVMIWDNP